MPYHKYVVWLAFLYLWILLVTITTCLVLVVTIAGMFWVYKTTRIRLVTGTNSTRSNTSNLRSHIVLSFTRGRGYHTYPWDQSEGTGGTTDTDFAHKFLDITRNFLGAE